MSDQSSCDVFVIFGITGDLAKVMTFRSLYRLEQRKLLDCPIVGVAVDDWSVDQLVERARTSIVGTGEQLDEDVFARLGAPVQLRRPATSATTPPTSGSATAIKGAQQPVFYLEIPPFLFGTRGQGARRSRAHQARPRRGREAVRARPRVGEGARRGAPPVHRRVAAPAHRPLPREDGARGDPLSPVRRTRCSSRSGTGTTSRACRSRWRRTSASRTAATSTIRSARCATSWSTTSCRWSRPPRWRRPRAAIPQTLKDAQTAAVQGRRHRRSRRTTSAASTTATARSTASPPTRPPRPTPRCGSTSRTGAGRACRSSSAPASGCR